MVKERISSFKEAGFNDPATNNESKEDSILQDPNRTDTLPEGQNKDASNPFLQEDDQQMEEQ